MLQVKVLTQHLVTALLQVICLRVTQWVNQDLWMADLVNQVICLLQATWLVDQVVICLLQATWLMDQVVICLLQATWLMDKVVICLLQATWLVDQVICLLQAIWLVDQVICLLQATWLVDQVICLLQVVQKVLLQERIWTVMDCLLLLRVWKVICLLQVETHYLVKPVLQVDHLQVICLQVIQWVEI
jgi:hypothetical protein